MFIVTEKLDFLLISILNSRDWSSLVTCFPLIYSDLWGERPGYDTLQPLVGKSEEEKWSTEFWLAHPLLWLEWERSPKAHMLECLVSS